MFFKRFYVEFLLEFFFLKRFYVGEVSVVHKKLPKSLPAGF